MSAFVVSMAAASMVLVAFVHDTGRHLSGYVSAADAAQNAARIGAQSIGDIRLGEPRIEADRAAIEAERYLIARGYTGTIRSDHQTVTVTIETKVANTLLTPLGVGSKKVRVTRSALVMGG